MTPGIETRRHGENPTRGSSCLRASVAWIVGVWLSPVSGQQLIDRVVARVDNYAITLTDVNAALALGVVEAPPGENRQAAAIRRLIERQLVLAEVARFVPAEPAAAMVDAEVAAMHARAGDRLGAIMESTGMDEARIREMARDTLRIQAYLNQRFGTSVQVSDAEVTQYYRAHPEEFTRNGTLMPFDEAEPIARQRTAGERRASTIAQWLKDLVARSEIVERSVTPPR
jgi:hypothetical protein